MARPRTQTYSDPQGKIRKSQLVGTFGPGAMVDLPDHAVLIGGLDFWNYSRTTVIKEPRLRDLLAARIGEGKLSLEAAFRCPPECNDQAGLPAVGVQALEFPQWYVCQNPKCRTLVGGKGVESKPKEHRHACSTPGGPSKAVPVRFVGACKKGHVQDLAWISFAHRGGQTCHSPELRLDEGVSGDFSEIVVHCRTCKASQPLSAAQPKGALGPCDGHRHHLGGEGRQPECGEPLQLLVRTASNSYFAQVVSALTVPDQGRDLVDAVATNWDVLAGATAQTLPVFRTIAKLTSSLAPYKDHDVLAAIAARKDGKVHVGAPLRTAEFRQFLAQPAEAPGDEPRASDVFFARRAKLPKSSLPSVVKDVVLATKLREVRVQIGFTRIEPISPDLQGEYDIGVSVASLGLTTDWLPAVEILGEGVFLNLDPARVREWESRPVVVARELCLREGFDAWASRFEGKYRPRFPGVRLYMLHSLAHLLITAISLECGYAASAIRERIYCAPDDDPLESMAAILLSTGSAGTEGTLGGLVDQGRHIGLHLRRAWDLGRLCSNDPVCATHRPDRDLTDRHLQGAACHGCLFIAECSCERFNGLLDRALVVPTIGNDPKLAFFGERP